MPSIDKSFLERLRCDFTEYPCFVETGTFKGHTILACEPHFERLYTVEIDKALYENAASQYTGNKITFLNGDSSVVFGYLLPILKFPTVFFLDGHWSSGETGKGAKDCPLMEEMHAIQHLFKEKCVVIIDDYRLFGKGPANDPCCNENWEEITKEKLISICSDRIVDMYHMDSEITPDDRLVLHLKSL